MKSEEDQNVNEKVCHDVMTELRRVTVRNFWIDELYRQA
jgi:hypothetical protein